MVLCEITGKDVVETQMVTLSDGTKVEGSLYRQASKDLLKSDVLEEDCHYCIKLNEDLKDAAYRYLKLLKYYVENNKSTISREADDFRKIEDDYGIKNFNKTSNCFTKEECIECWTYICDKSGVKLKGIHISGDLTRYLKVIYLNRCYDAPKTI